MGAQGVSSALAKMMTVSFSTLDAYSRYHDLWGCKLKSAESSTASCESWADVAVFLDAGATRQLLD